MRRGPLDGADVALAAGVVAFMALAWVWAAMTLAGLLAGAAAVPPAQTPAAALQTLTHPFCSAPVAPGAAPAWLVSLLAAVLLALLVRLALTSRARALLDQGRDLFGGDAGRGARWARPRDLASLTVPDDVAPGRLVLGRSAGRKLATQHRHSVIVFGPTGSFKTSGLAIPAIRDWGGPVLCASVKTDLLRHTIEQREERGAVLIFDPTQSTGMPSDGWSPLSQCASWPGALRVAQWLCTATHTGGSGGDLDFWYRAAKKLLAPMLFAAANSGRSMGDVVRWVDHQVADEVDQALQATGCDEAVGAWIARELRDDRQRGSIYTTLETVLDAYQDQRVLLDAERAGISRSAFLDGQQNTLYVCAPSDDQDALRSIFSTLILSITTAVYEKATKTHKPLDPPLLLVLDELANVAPVPRLDVLASTGRDQGIQQLSILQDFSQLEERFGPRRARTIVNNHHAKLVLAGQSDRATLDLVGQLLGEEELDQTSTALSEGRTTRTSSTTFRRLAPADRSREQARGEGILVYGNLPPVRLKLRPWFE